MTLIIALALVFCALFVLFLFLQKRRASTLPPLESIGYSPIYGHIKSLSAESLLPFCDELALSENKISRLSLGPSWLPVGGDLFVLSDPEAIREFVAQSNSFKRSLSEKKKFDSLVSPLCAIALEEGALWRKHTKFMSRFYFKGNLTRVVDSFHEPVNVFLERIAQRGGATFMELMHDLSLDIICDIAFTHSLNVQRADSELAKAVRVIFRSLKDAVFTDGSNVSASAEHVAAMEVLKSFVASKLEDRLRQDPEDWPADFLSIFAAEFAASNFTLDEVLGELCMVICAGYETTSNTIGFLVQHLAEAPAVQRELREEVDAVVWGEASYENLMEQMPFLKSCLEESQRLDPVGLWVSRVTTREMTVMGKCIPRGSSVIVNNYSMCRKASLFPNPLCFDPHRFANDAVASMSHLPFGIGQRACQGRKLAQLESYYVMVRILQQFEIVPAAATSFSKSIEFTLTPHTNVTFIDRSLHCSV